MPNKMKSNNPPRRVDIRGQDHLLAYITPDEAQLLMDNGGSGEPGPMGIPAFPPSERDSSGRDTGSGREGGSSRGGSSGRSGPRGGRGGGRASAGMDTARGRGRSEDRDAAQAAIDRAADRAREAAQDRAIEAEIANRAKYQETYNSVTPGQATAMFGDATMSGIKGFTSSDIDRMLGSASVDVTGMLPELQRRAKRTSQFSTLGKIFSPATSAIQGILGLPASSTSYDNLATLIGMPGSTITSGGLFGPDRVLSAPTGGTGAFGIPANLSQGYFGQVSYTGMPDPDYEGPFANLVGGYQGVDRGGDGREVVPTQTNPVTGEQQCPEGYVFDADIQACRVSSPLANVGETVGGDGFTYEPGTYARMGLLDVAPEDLGGFASTYGTGFMTPEEFEAANLEYRRRAGTQAGIFQDPYNLQGYTLLA